jgi:nucleotide-binding universal stress UspA family protein
VMIAVDLAHGVDELASALRLQAGAILETQSNTRIAFVTVLKTALLSVESESQPDGHNAYVQRLIELKDWARPLVNHEDVVSYHVLEAVDAAAALIEYAHHNNVDHIVLGARGSSTVRRYLGSVSSQVVAQALCTVTVVRLKQMAEHKLA